MSRYGLSCGLIALVAALAAAGPAGAAGLTERVSVGPGGGQANDVSEGAAVSADGRYVAFQSYASNLAAGDLWNLDVFVHDRLTGATELVSVNTRGQQASADSFLDDDAISADGRHIAFATWGNLVTEDTNGEPDIFVRNRQAGTTERVSVATGGEQANASSPYAAISPDGRHVAFQSFASNLVLGDTNGDVDVFLHDREIGRTERVSVATGGAQANAGSPGTGDLAVSADGYHVAFDSTASDLVPGDTNGEFDVFLRDPGTDATERVSVATDGTQGNSGSWGAAISADGRHVAFASSASNLVAGDTNGDYDVFVRDRLTGTTERVSLATGGPQGDDHSWEAAISADGRHVAFTSWASNLVAGDTNGTGDVFLHDRQTGATERVSLRTNGMQGNDESVNTAVSADGRHVAFDSLASNLVAGDTNLSGDVFVRDRAGIACSDFADNDGDGLTDHPADSGCSSPADNNEANPRCDDGLDNDQDGAADYPADPGCSSPADNNEANPRCNDGRDNDNDGKADYPADPGCTSQADNNETNPQCNDGRDNDNDGAVDYPADPGCKSSADNNETNA